MPDSKAISVRIPSQLLDSLDVIAEKDYPPRGNGKPNRSQVLLDALDAYAKHRQNENTSSDNVNTTVSDSVSKQELYDALDSERKDIERIMDSEIHKAIKPALDKIYERLEALEQRPAKKATAIPQEGSASTKKQADDASQRLEESTNKIFKMAEDTLEALNTTQLAQRLNVGRYTIYDHCKRGDIAQWTARKDEEGISWVYDEHKRIFSPTKQ